MRIVHHYKEDRARFVILLVLSIFFIASVVVFSVPSLKSRMTGLVLATVNIKSASHQYCNMTLYSGWNLVSVPCFLNSEPLDDEFAGLYMTSIFAYDATDSGDPWKSHNPSLDGNYTQDLTSLSKLSGYYFLMYTDQNYSTSNYLTYPYSISMVNGWNLVGYPNLTAKEINESTSSIFGSYNIIRTMNNSNKTQLYFIYGDENSTLNYTYTFQGYWFNMSQADTWVVE